MPWYVLLSVKYLSAPFDQVPSPQLFFLAFISQSVRVSYLLLAESNPGQLRLAEGSYLFRLIQLPVNSSEECSEIARRGCSQNRERKKKGNFWGHHEFIFWTGLSNPDLFPLAGINCSGLSSCFSVVNLGQNYGRQSFILKRCLNRCRNSSFWEII